MNCAYTARWVTLGTFPLARLYAEEELLIKGLERLKVKQGTFKRTKDMVSHLHKIISTPKEALPYLQRSNSIALKIFQKFCSKKSCFMP